ncbi:MAG TPA: NADPH-dependent glutamate synthase [Armatimonadota bacterium]
MPRQQQAARDAEERTHDFTEVALGFTAEQAQIEAQRCIQCGKPGCVGGCPVSIDIPVFIKAVAEGRFSDALGTIHEANMLPAICGRVCPQENQCEKECVLARKFGAVSIGSIERFVADEARLHGENHAAAPPASPTGRKVAIIGSGPSGLACAGDLARLGHSVTVFEALHRPGGVLIYGIPEFRLPKDIVAKEIAALERMGVHFEMNVVIGRTITIDELFESGFEAVFVGSGAGLPVFLGIPGENLCGVFSANEYLTRVNLMGAYDSEANDTPVFVGRKVVVIGGGNVAMDAARVAKRLGPESVTILYRRTRAELPARQEEVHHAEEEGIEFKFLAAPTRILGTETRWVCGIECLQMELGEPDASGRRRPVEVPGSEYVLDCDMVIVAIGNSPHPLVPQTTPGLAVTPRGNIVADHETGQTPRAGLFAGGDIVTGAATVIEAMGAGRRAAKAISEYLETT